MTSLYDIETMLIPQLLQHKEDVLRSFNMGNNIRVYSGLEPESSNEISQYAEQIQAEIDSRQITEVIA